MDGTDNFVSGDLDQSDTVVISLGDHSAGTRRKRLRKQEGIKRACNECRQQKVQHNNNPYPVFQRLLMFLCSFDVMSFKSRFRHAHDAGDSA